MNVSGTLFLRLSVADIPGIIRGAHEDRGLGSDFLRHIRRCPCILYVLDMSVDDPWMQFNALRYELEMYEDGMSQTPHAIVANKIDLPMGEKNLRRLRRQLHDDDTVDLDTLDILPISARYGTNVHDVMTFVRSFCEKHVQHPS